MMTFPHPLDASRTVVWNGRNFEIDGALHSVLAYPVGASGWNDGLTQLHEEATGAATHFIDIASRQCAMQSLKLALGNRPATILEVGCSGGHLLRDMQRQWPNACLIGGDYTLDTLHTLSKTIPTIPLVRFDLTRCPLPTASVDAAVLLNVLEHIEDHEAALQHLARIIKPGGQLVLEVPAGPELFDDYDRQLMHFRRYTLGQLVDLVEEAGFSVTSRNYLGALIYPAFRLSKLRSQRKRRNQAERAIHVRRSIQSTYRFNRIGMAVMQVEALLRSVLTFPKGIRCVVSARRP